MRALLRLAAILPEDEKNADLCTRTERTVSDIAIDSPVRITGEEVGKTVETEERNAQEEQSRAKEKLL